MLALEQALRHATVAGPLDVGHRDGRILQCCGQALLRERCDRALEVPSKLRHPDADHNDVACVHVAWLASKLSFWYQFYTQSTIEPEGVPLRQPRRNSRLSEKLCSLIA